MAAAADMLRSPMSVTVEDQADRFPDSNPLLKIRSACAVGVLVGIGLAVFVAVIVSNGTGVNVAVGVLLGCKVGAGWFKSTSEKLSKIC